MLQVFLKYSVEKYSTIVTTSQERTRH